MNKLAIGDAIKELEPSSGAGAQWSGVPTYKLSGFAVFTSFRLHKPDLQVVKNRTGWRDPSFEVKEL